MTVAARASAIKLHCLFKPVYNWCCQGVGVINMLSRAFCVFVQTSTSAYNSKDTALLNYIYGRVKVG